MKTTKISEVISAVKRDVNKYISCQRKYNKQLIKKYSTVIINGGSGTSEAIETVQQLLEHENCIRKFRSMGIVWPKALEEFNKHLLDDTENDTSFYDIEYDLGNQLGEVVVYINNTMVRLVFISSPDQTLSESNVTFGVDICQRDVSVPRTDDDLYEYNIDLYSYNCENTFKTIVRWIYGKTKRGSIKESCKDQDIPITWIAGVNHDHYSITNTGTVINNYLGRKLKFLGADGYNPKRVVFVLDDFPHTTTTMSVEHLVFRAFGPLLPPGITYSKVSFDHIDGMPDNCSLENLRPVIRGTHNGDNNPISLDDYWLILEIIKRNPDMKDIDIAKKCSDMIGRKIYTEYIKIVKHRSE